MPYDYFVISGDMGYTCTELTAYQMAKKRNLFEAVQAFDEYYKNKPKK